MKLERLGPYQIGRALGRGGMGTVFEATDPATGQQYAVKVLAAHLADSEGFRERFEVEIETLKKLSHPNIVRLYAWGEEEGHLFYSMELVRGATLEEELRQGRRFDWREVTRIGIQICKALKHAHDHGVIHRDLKPANLLWSEGQEIKLADFGIAKLFGASSMTSTGGVIGTAEFMAPEQVDGRPVTNRSDLYSLGGVLYALCARRAPFVANSVVDMLRQQREVVPERVGRYNRDVPEELEDLIAELLEKDPEKRPRNAMGLTRRLEAMEHGLARREQRKQQPQISPSAHTMAEAAEPADAGFSISSLKPPAGAPLTLPATGASPPVIQPPSNLLGETIGATAAPDGAAPVPAAPDMSVAAGQSNGAASAAPAVPARPKTRFTTLAEEEELERPGPYSVSPQVWMLALFLAGTGLMVWLVFLREPNADRLYDRIVAAAEENRIERLVDVEDELRDFLRYHAGDARVNEVQDYLEDVELHRLERSLERQARLRSKSESLSPVEKTYIEAIRQAESDPDAAAEQLRAFVGFYEDETGGPKATERCLKLARRRLVRLEEQAHAQRQEHLTVLRQRLRRADELRVDHPEQARPIYAGAIALYGEKPWAALEVTRARAGLAELPPAPAPPVEP